MTTASMLIHRYDNTACTVLYTLNKLKDTYTFLMNCTCLTVYTIKWVVKHAQTPVSGQFKNTILPTDSNSKS